MSDDGRWRTVRADADGVKVRRRPGVRGGVLSLALGIVLAAVALLVATRRPWLDDPVELAEVESPAAGRRGDIPPPVADRRQGDGREDRQGAGRRVPFSVRRKPAGEAASAVAPLPPADALAGAGNEPAERAAAAPGTDAEAGDDGGAQSADMPTGIQLFPAPGTDPPKVGIVVPEGFELPEGYVRHYQATDDGKMLPAILMFHPDYEFFDATGEKVAVPPNNVVPPEFAPQGLAIEMLEVPEVRLDDGLDF